MGMEGGNALAHILFGDVDPSGKLPCTIAKRLDDYPPHGLDAYPGAIYHLKNRGGQRETTFQF